MLVHLSTCYSPSCSNFDDFVELLQTVASCRTQCMGDSLNEEACVYPSRSVEGILSYTPDTGILGLALLNTDGKTK
jgi:hypothetical protein